MKIGDEAESLLDSILEEWDKAEGLIKTAELTCGSVIFPAIQELRYAGRRLIDGLHELKVNPESEEGLKYLQDAHFDCLRARHDAIDASISKITSNIEIASSELGADVVLKAFPDFSKLMHCLFEVRSKIELSRRDRENRDATYTSIEASELKTIFPLYKQFCTSEEMMKQLADERAAELRNSIKHRNVGYFLAVLGLAAGFGFFILSL